MAMALVASQADSAHAQAKSRLDEVLATGRLRVGTTGDFRPMSFTDPATGEYTGYDIDVIARLASDLGVRVEFVATDWSSLVQGILDQRYELTTSAALTTDRATVAAFSDPVVKFGSVPMVLKDNAERFRTWASIDEPGIAVAVLGGTVFEQQARTFFPNTAIVVVQPPGRAFQEVIAGRAQVLLTSNVEAAALTAAYPDLVMTAHGEPRDVRLGGFLTARDDPIWLHFLNTWIAMTRESGLFANLQRKWGLTPAE
jgi:cyclohexadienyl dehydratase